MGKKTEKNCRLGAVGGQAVLEGVMMKHGDRYSVAVRKDDGKIAVCDRSYVSVRKKHKIFNLPLIRGVVNMIEMLILSFGTLDLSARMFGLEDEAEESKFEKWMKKHFGKSVLDLVMGFAMILGIALSIFLFVFLPAFLTGGLEKLFKTDFGFWKNLIEGGLKVAVFVGYLLLCLLMKDIRRTFEYHGAEHKSIFCYEAGEELTPENVKKHKRFHPRCGTSFMFVIIIISILISSLPIFTWDNIFLRMLTKLLFLPLVVGLGFEFIMYAGRHDNIVVRILSAPGLLMQRITTREPDLDQIEVAINALKSSMPDVFPDYVHPFPEADLVEDEEEAKGAAEVSETEVVGEEAEVAQDGKTEETEDVKSE